MLSIVIEISLCGSRAAAFRAQKFDGFAFWELFGTCEIEGGQYDCQPQKEEPGEYSFAHIGSLPAYDFHSF